MISPKEFLFLRVDQHVVFEQNLVYSIHIAPSSGAIIQRILRFLPMSALGQKQTCALGDVR
jgi:hypothetical protein